MSDSQPFAVGIIRGTIRIEYRSGPTRIRGRVYIYASKSRYSAEEDAEYMEQMRITDVGIDELPRGVLIGTVELVDCNNDEWYVRLPQRLKTPNEPVTQPQPIWFYPFMLHPKERQAYVYRTRDEFHGDSFPDWIKWSYPISGDNRCTEELSRRSSDYWQSRSYMPRSSTR